MVRVKMSEVDERLTDTELKELSELDKRPILYDDDSPEMTQEMLDQFHRFDCIPIRVSRDTIQKAKSFDKDYRGFLSRLLEAAFNDNNLVKKCI